MGSGLDDTAPLQQHIDHLLLILSPKGEELKELWTDYELTIQCVGYFPASGHGTHLSRGTVRTSAGLGLSFDFDYYFVDDYEHDV